MRKHSSGVPEVVEKRGRKKNKEIMVKVVPDLDEIYKPEIPEFNKTQTEETKLHKGL